MSSPTSAAILTAFMLTASLQAQPKPLPSDVESLRSVIRTEPDRLTRIVAISNILRVLPKDEPTLAALEEMAKEAVRYDGPSPEVYLNRLPVPRKLNPEFERLAVARGETSPGEYGLLLSRDSALVVILAASSFHVHVPCRFCWMGSNRRSPALP